MTDKSAIIEPQEGLLRKFVKSWLLPLVDPVKGCCNAAAHPPAIGPKLFPKRPLAI